MPGMQVSCPCTTFSAAAVASAAGGGGSQALLPQLLLLLLKVLHMVQQRLDVSRKLRQLALDGCSCSCCFHTFRTLVPLLNSSL